MAATVQTRRPHRKVRTGCLTCKARRKKCDEAKPSCSRCIIAGFRCDGYADIAIVRADFDKASSKVQPVVVFPPQPAFDPPSESSSDCSSPWRGDSPSAVIYKSWITPATSVSGEESEESECNRTSRALIRLGRQHHMYTYNSTSSAPFEVAITRTPNALADLEQISDLEVHCFAYVQHKTLPKFAAYFDNSAWRVDLQHAALMAHHPVVFKAVTALGAVHRRFCYGISREAFEYCFHAARWYDDAVKALSRFKRSKAGHYDSEALRVIAASESVLAIFQGFQGNLEACSAHVRAGIHSSITTPLQLIHSQEYYYAKTSPPRILCTMLYQLYCRATELFGEPALTCSLDPSFQPRGELKLPDLFSNLVEMKDSLFSVIAEVWRHFRCVEDSWIRLTYLKPYEKYIHTWTSACLRTLESGLVMEPGQVKAFNLLNMTHCVLCLSIQGNMLKCGQNEVEPVPQLPILKAPGDGDDDFSEAAAELCEAVKHMYAVRDSDLSHVRWMFEQTRIRHNIFSFNRLSMAETSVSGVNEILNMWTIANKVGETQEDAVIEALQDIIPPDASGIDIGDLWRETRKIMLRFYEPNKWAPGYRWVTQYWTY